MFHFFILTFGIIDVSTTAIKQIKETYMFESFPTDLRQPLKPLGLFP